MPTKALTTSLLQNPGQLGWVVNPQRELFKNSLPDKYKERCHAALVAGVGRGELNTIGRRRVHGDNSGAQLHHLAEPSRRILLRGAGTASRRAEPGRLLLRGDGA